MMDVIYTPQHFATTRDSLSPNSLAALIDFAEGNPFALFQDPWVFGALEDRGLVKHVYDGTAVLAMTGYGQQFVAWYRQPRDLPGQLSLFE